VAVDGVSDSVCTMVHNKRCQNETILIMSFGTRNPEKIPHQKVTNFFILPVK